MLTVHNDFIHCKEMVHEHIHLNSFSLSLSFSKLPVALGPPAFSETFVYPCALKEGLLSTNRILNRFEQTLKQGILFKYSESINVGFVNKCTDDFCGKANITEEALQNSLG